MPTTHAFDCERTSYRMESLLIELKAFRGESNSAEEDGTDTRIHECDVI